MANESADIPLTALGGRITRNRAVYASLGVCGGNVKTYIECFHADGSQILGNLDGQAVIRARNYRRTNAYKRLARIVGNPSWMNGKVAFARIVSEDGRILETVKPIESGVD